MMIKAFMAQVGIGMALSMAAGAADGPPDGSSATRAPNEGELQSFAAYYQAPPGAVARPAFEIRRHGQGWAIEAWTEDKPQRAAWTLCLARRHGHAFDGKSWRPSGATRQMVWLDRASDCGVTAARVELRAALGDRDIVTVLQGQAAVLQGARLLFAGNTQCAPHRARPFTLAAVDTGKDGLLLLTYRSARGEHAVQAQVSVRKRGRELTAWNVQCE